MKESEEVLQSTLQQQFAPTVLPIVMELPNETLVLQGKDGSTAKTHKERVGICHLPDLSVDVDRKNDEDISSDHVCEILRSMSISCKRRKHAFVQNMLYWMALRLPREKAQTVPTAAAT